MLWHRRETRRPTEKTKLNLRTGRNLPTRPIERLGLTASSSVKSKNRRPDPQFIFLLLILKLSWPRIWLTLIALYAFESERR